LALVQSSCGQEEHRLCDRRTQACGRRIVKKSSSICLAAILALTLLEDSVRTATRFPSYSITDLGTLGGTESFAYAINDRGHIVGSSRLAGNTVTHGFLFGFGRMIDLNPLNSGEIQTVGPADINNHGAVASGFMRDGVYSAAIFDTRSGEITALGSLGGIAFGSFNGTATSVNDSGEVVGYSYVDDLNRHAFVYKNGLMKDLGSLGGYSAALSINNAGDIVGFSSESAYGAAHPILYRNGKMSAINPFGDPSNEGIAWKLNNRGEVVGEAVNGSSINGFIYFKGAVTNIGTLDGGRNSFAYSINTVGQVVGVADVPFEDDCYDFDTQQTVRCTNYAFQGFLYERGVMLDLRSLVGSNSGWDALWPFDINDRGQIVGYGLRAGEFRAFLMTPTDERFTQVR
jgi:probable HAF family extracellular repeat protein